MSITCASADVFSQCQTNSSETDVCPDLRYVYLFCSDVAQPQEGESLADMVMSMMMMTMTMMIMM